MQEKNSKDTPLFSVVMVTYNTERYITQALDSIIEQKHNYLYEIIIGDDFSTDGTRDILMQYKEKYSDIITLIFNENNLGMIKNYFNVLSHCWGKYIMACADDYWLPGRVEQQIQYMEMHPETGMVYGKVQLYYEKESKFGEIAGSKTTTVYELMKINGIPAQTFCIQNELVKKYIREIDPLSKEWLYEDYPMWFWFAYNSKIKFIDTIFAVYCIREGSIAHPKNIENKISIYDNIIAIRKFYADYYKITLFIDDLNQIKYGVLWDSRKCPSKKDYLYFIGKLNLEQIENKCKFHDKMAYKSYLLFLLMFFIRKIYRRIKWAITLCVNSKTMQPD